VHWAPLSVTKVSVFSGLSLTPPIPNSTTIDNWNTRCKCNYFPKRETKTWLNNETYYYFLVLFIYMLLIKSI
jgi:hypothetical protein